MLHSYSNFSNVTQNFFPFRHKIIITVTIIEKTSQSVETTLGFRWDGERDKYSTFSLEERTFYANCSVFGVYYE